MDLSAFVTAVKAKVESGEQSIEAAIKHVIAEATAFVTGEESTIKTDVEGLASTVEKKVETTLDKVEAIQPAGVSLAEDKAAPAGVSLAEDTKKPGFSTDDECACGVPPPAPAPSDASLKTGVKPL